MSTEADITAVVDEASQRLNDGSLVWKPKNKRGWYIVQEDGSLKSDSVLTAQRTIVEAAQELCPNKVMWWFVQRCETELRKRLAQS